MNETRRVVCTGMGVVSPLGLGVKKSWSALLKSKTSSIAKLKDQHSFEGCQSRVAAYVPDHQLETSLTETQHTYITRNAKQLSRASTFAMLAAHEALADAKLLDETDGKLINKLRPRCGVAVGQGMVDFQDIYENGCLVMDREKKASGYRRMSPFFMTRALMNMSAGNISIRYGMNGPNHCVSTACATGAHSIGDAMNFIKTGQADLMVCGSTEASINSIAMAGFERLRALCTKYNDKPEEASRPFDENRAGFVMGEGAGIIILEEMNHARSRGMGEDQIYCEMLGYGTSADAHHLTAPAPDGLGATMCMKSAIRSAGLKASDISHINAHATSTPLGDDIECNAIETTLLNNENTSHDLTVTSCKAAIGHLLGGAGSVETIFAILSCRDALFPHCLNLEKPLSTGRNLVKFVKDSPQKWDLERRILIKNSFGFGGTNASLILSNFLR